jgi:hypothetical protein
MLEEERGPPTASKKRRPAVRGYGSVRVRVGRIGRAWSIRIVLETFQLLGTERVQLCWSI